MRSAAFISFLFFSTLVFAQQADSLSVDTANMAAIHKRIYDDINTYTDSINKKMVDQQTQQGINYFMRIQEKRKAKQKKQAIIRIAIGLGFLVILVIGLVRKRKMTKQGR